MHACMQDELTGDLISIHPRSHVSHIWRIIATELNCMGGMVSKRIDDSAMVSKFKPSCRSHVI
jgi:hypothetical protein